MVVDIWAALEEPERFVRQHLQTAWFWLKLDGLDDRFSNFVYESGVTKFTRNYIKFLVKNPKFLENIIFTRAFIDLRKSKNSFSDSLRNSRLQIVFQISSTKVACTGGGSPCMAVSRGML